VTASLVLQSVEWKPRQLLWSKEHKVMMPQSSGATCLQVLKFRTEIF